VFLPVGDAAAGVDISCCGDGKIWPGQVLKKIDALAKTS
jgi:hypothetical protein